MKSSDTTTQGAQVALQSTQVALLVYIATISAVFTFSLNESIQEYFGFSGNNKSDLLLVTLGLLILLFIGFTLTVSTLKPREESQQEKEQRFKKALLPLEILLASIIGFLCVAIASMAETTSSTNWFLILINKGNTFLADLVTKNLILSLFLFTIIFGSFLFGWQSHRWEKLILKIKKIFT